MENKNNNVNPYDRAKAFVGLFVSFAIIYYIYRLLRYGKRAHKIIFFIVLFILLIFAKVNQPTSDYTSDVAEPHQITVINND